MFGKQQAAPQPQQQEQIPASQHAIQTVKQIFDLVIQKGLLKDTNEAAVVHNTLVYVAQQLPKADEWDKLQASTKEEFRPVKTEPKETQVVPEPSSNGVAAQENA